MKILVTGVSGVVGGAVVRALIARRNEVVADVGSVAKFASLPIGLEAVIGDLLDPSTASRLVNLVDGVVHAAQIRTGAGASSPDKEAAAAAADLRMIESLAQTCLRFAACPLLLYTSGVWVYCDRGDAWVHEDSPARPTVASHGHRAAAQRLFDLHRTQGLRATIMLQGLVYGAADDLGRAYVCALERPAPGHRFNVVDDEPVALRDFMYQFARCARRPAPKPMDTAHAQAVLGAPLAVSMALSVRGSDAKATRRMLGWAPTYRSINIGLPALLLEWQSAERSTTVETA